ITSSYYPVEQLVSKGVLILEPNYRGSEGHGRDFRKLNYRNLGIGDYEDVVSGVDRLIEKGFVDKDLVGVMGWSQGGYISAFCATYGNRFKAASVGAGISNWMTYHVNTDIHEFCHRYLGNNPWEDPQIYEQTSPMTYIKNASTPTLIQHGASDTRVPPPNAFELYQGLREMGVPVRLVIYKGMGHGADKPGIHRAIMRQNLAWFSHYLLDEPLEEALMLKQSEIEKTEEK
ncbi:MAG: prolyl oligopeptidase family serine peptidase, partial [Mesotoga sp.]|uniref:S9 family peptidase n=1 Tax=Mesotoga sp. TaxID=2053577 RepID=UPI003564C37F